MPDFHCPEGCAAESTDPLARCSAELRGRACLMCQRDSKIPHELEWDGGPGYQVAARQHVQAIHMHPGKGTWAVVAFKWGRVVDGRFPPILVNGRARAMELAKERAKQMGGGRLRRFVKADDSWFAGHILILPVDVYT